MTSPREAAGARHPGGRRVEPVMGTVVSIAVRTELPPAVLDAAIDSAVACLHRADADFSTYRPDSWVSRLRRHEIELADCPGQLRDVLRLAELCRRRSAGSFDPAWRGDGTLDPTGLVKGWAADAASAVLTAAGAVDHCVNAAGDVRVRATAQRPWRVGVADPLAAGRLVAVVEAAEIAVATSGTAERGAHIVCPATGVPVSDLASATVVGPDLALADGYATAAVAAGPQAVDFLAELEPEGWAWLLVSGTGAIRRSGGFPGAVAMAAGQGPRAVPGVPE
ncbi:FAD:protein FMN transferase [Frankia sp. R43]|uniref:FAD:protein FMN transferase n=1 Tax=Frankia sp. R43 TaxID=269536 RepID=UPI00350F115F